MADYPSELQYTKDHEWARAEGSRVTVGITQHAVDALGDITLVNIDAAVGSVIEVGKPFGTVESVKAVSDLYAPLSGRIVEINPAFTDSPELINEDPYKKGWMVAIEPSGALPSTLMDSAAYTTFVATLDH